MPEAVFTVNRNRPLWVISTQHGAVWPSGNGEDPVEVSVPFAASRNAETVPSGAGVVGVGYKQLVRVGGAELAAERPGALGGERRCRGGRQPPVAADGEAVDLGGPHAGPASLRPVPLNSTSPGWAPSGRVTAEPAIGAHRPLGRSRKPV